MADHAKDKRPFKEKKTKKKKDSGESEETSANEPSHGSAAGSASEGEGRERSFSSTIQVVPVTAEQKAAVNLQSLIRGHNSRLDYLRLKKMSDKRSNVTKELFATEKNFLTRLGVVISVFKKPLEDVAESETPFVNKANLRSMFSDIEVVVGLNEVLYQELTDRMAKYHPNSIFADAFVKVAPFFRWYQSYVGNYEKAFHTLQALKKNPQFAAFLKAAEAKPECNYSDLESLLILPVQRVPQYNLLLADLLKVTPESHPDYPHTKEAVALMDEIGAYVNEKKRESENIAKVVRIGEKLDGFPNLAVPYRRYLLDGDFIQVNDYTVGAVARNVHLYVFNDIILFTVEKDKKFVVEQYAYYDRIGVVETPAKDIPAAWDLKLKDQTLSLLAPDATVKSKFTQIILQTAASIKRRESENEQLKELRRSLVKANHTKPSDTARHLGVLASGLTESSSSPSASQQDEESGSEQQSEAEKAEAKKAEEERERRRRNKEKINQQVLSLLAKQDQEFNSVAKYGLHRGIEAHFVCPVSYGSEKQHRLLMLTQDTVYLAKLKKDKDPNPTNFHLLEIQSVTSSSDASLTLNLIRNSIELRSDFVDDFLYHLRRTYLLTFPGAPELKLYVDASRVPPILINLKTLACGGLANTFKAYCSYYNVTPREDIIWDIKHANHSCGPFLQIDFGLIEYPVDYGDFRALTASLRHNKYFSGLVLKNVSLSKESMLSVVELLKFNESFQKFDLSSNVISKDFYIPLTEAFAHNAEAKTIKFLDVSNNPGMEEKGLQFFVQHLQLVKDVALQYLDISNCNIGSKTIATIFSQLRKATSIWHTLTHLNLGGNVLQAEALGALCAFLATPCSLKFLSVANCQIKLDTLLEAVTRGCLYLTNLDISGNKLLKSTAAILVRLAQGGSTLTHLTISNTMIPSVALGDLLRALSHNPYLNHFHFIADDNDLGFSGATELSKAIAETAVKGLNDLSLKNNDFGDDGITQISKALLTTETQIENLKLDGNFRFKDRTSRENCILTLAAMIESPTCHLRLFSMTGGERNAQQLKSDITPVLSALGRTNIHELNISGHRMGPKGIFALARALQVNHSLYKLYWDENLINLEGFERFVDALKSNATLLECPVPLIDVGALATSLKYASGTAEGMVQLQRLLTAVSELQSRIANNHATRAKKNSLLSELSKTSKAASKVPNSEKVYRKRSKGEVELADKDKKKSVKKAEKEKLAKPKDAVQAVGHSVSDVTPGNEPEELPKTRPRSRTVDRHPTPPSSENSTPRGSSSTTASPRTKTGAKKKSPATGSDQVDKLDKTDKPHKLKKGATNEKLKITSGSKTTKATVPKKRPSLSIKSTEEQEEEEQEAKKKSALAAAGRLRPLSHSSNASPIQRASDDIASRSEPETGPSSDPPSVKSGKRSVRGSGRTKATSGGATSLVKLVSQEVSEALSAPSTPKDSGETTPKATPPPDASTATATPPEAASGTATSPRELSPDKTGLGGSGQRPLPRTASKAFSDDESSKRSASDITFEISPSRRAALEHGSLSTISEGGVATVDEVSRAQSPGDMTDVASDEETGEESSEAVPVPTPTVIQPTITAIQPLGSPRTSARTPSPREIRTNSPVREAPKGEAGDQSGSGVSTPETLTSPRIGVKPVDIAAAPATAPPTAAGLSTRRRPKQPLPLPISKLRGNRRDELSESDVTEDEDSEAIIEFLGDDDSSNEEIGRKRPHVGDITDEEDDEDDDTYDPSKSNDEAGSDDSDDESDDEDQSDVEEKPKSKTPPPKPTEADDHSASEDEGEAAPSAHDFPSPVRISRHGSSPSSPALTRVASLKYSTPTRDAQDKEERDMYDDDGPANTD